MTIPPLALLVALAGSAGPDAPGRPAPPYVPPPLVRAPQPAPAPEHQPSPGAAVVPAGRPPAAAPGFTLRLIVAGARVEAQVVRFAARR